MRLLRSQLFVTGALILVVGLLITVLSIAEWRRQIHYDELISTTGTPIEGNVVGVVTQNRDGVPLSVRVTYQYKGARDAVVQLAGYAEPERLDRNSKINLLVADDEPSSPRLVESVGGGDAAAWRNGALAGGIVTAAGLGLVVVPIVRERRLG